MGPKFSDQCSYRRGEGTQSYGEEKPCEGGDRDKSDAATSQGMPSVAGSHQHPGRGKEGLFPRAFRGSMAQLTLKISDF